MDDRRRQVSGSKLGLFAVAAVAGLAALKGRSRARSGLRLLGLWAYLSVVNRGGHNAKLARKVQRACQDDDAVTPYWGYQPRRVAERSLQPAAWH